ncbi:MAG: DNA polymerase IV [Gammaproteobacteria bacterium]|nr:DNA polymerase IV [Gammaproteobacteria bacterium]
MDAFYASVEQHDNPQLKGKPVIVGGKPDGRGVVAACSYEARQFGVHSAMPSSVAGRLCPDAHFLKPRFERYRSVSQTIQSTFSEYTELVEPLSLDEAYLDVTHSIAFDGYATRIAKDIKNEIYKRTGLVASAGVSYNKFIAKIASDIDKPNGFYCVLPEDGEAFVAALPIGKFYGVGKATEARMNELGIQTGLDLRQWSLAELTTEFGKSANYFYNACRGIDHRPVRQSRVRKSIGAERTFGNNLGDRDEMLEILNDLARSLIHKLSERDLVGNTITIKVRFPDFETLNRSHQHRGRCLTEADALECLPFLLDRALSTREQPSVRLLGVSISQLEELDATQPAQLRLPLPPTSGASH